jgi:hypothetical protein
MEATVKARRFELVDDEGHVRVALWCGADNQQPGVYLYDRNGGARASLQMRPEGNPAIVLFTPGGRNRLQLDLLPDGSPFLSMFDGAGTLRFSVSLHQDGRPELVLLDERANPLAGIRVMPQGAVVFPRWTVIRPCRASEVKPQTCGKRG